MKFVQRATFTTEKMFVLSDESHQTVNASMGNAFVLPAMLCTSDVFITASFIGTLGNQSFGSYGIISTDSKHETFKFIILKQAFSASIVRPMSVSSPTYEIVHTVDPNTAIELTFECAGALNAFGHPHVHMNPAKLRRVYEINSCSSLSDG